MKIVSLLLFLSSIFSMVEAKTVFEFNDCKVMTSKDKKTLVFPVVDAEKRQIRLHLTARFDWKSLSGYTFGMKIFVNGKDITGVRLLNKPLAFKTRSGGGTYWSRPDINRWNVVYSPDFSDKVKTDVNFRYGIYEKDQEPYEYVFDLSGLTSHGQDNEIVIIPQYSVPVIFKDVRVEIDENAMPRINEPEITPAPTGKLSNMQLKNLPSVIPFMKCGNNNYPAPFGMELSTKLSLPQGKFMNIAPDKLKDAKLPFSVVYETENYTLTRKFSAVNSYIHIVDIFKNKTDKLIGIRFENSLKLTEKPVELLRAGVKTFMKYSEGGGNPTVFARMKNSSTAIVLEDDISRIQSLFFCNDKEIGFKNDRLGIAPKESHILEWNIYKLPVSDYYDFINLVRQDWDLNFTWNGPQEYPYFGAGAAVWQQIQQWVRKPIQESTVRNFLSERPVKILKTHVAANYSVKKDSRETPRLGHGTAIPHFKWWCNMTSNMTSAFKKYAPDVEVYAYIHKNLCSEVGNRGKYRDSEALDGTSRILSARGIQMRYVPTVNNSYGKALANTYRYMVEEMGTHIYMDEISVSVTEPAEYPEWDGCSVKIDPKTNEVISKISYPNLLSRGWIEEMIAYLKSKKRKLLCNTPPYTKTLLSHKLMHFVEAGTGESGLINAHLSTPLGFDYARGEKGFNHFRTCLKSGALALPWSGLWSEYCFPFTPLELRAGYIIGKERIITSVSGNFGWNDKSDAEVFIFDGKGKTVEDMAKKISVNGNYVYEIRMPGDHVAIIVKKEFVPLPRNAAVKDDHLEKLFRKWRILEANLRAESAKYMDFTAQGLLLDGKERKFSYFDMTALPATEDAKVNIIVDVASGTGTVSIGYIAYCELPWRKPFTVLQSYPAKKGKITMSRPIGIKGVQGIRPVILIPKGSKILIKDYKINIQNKDL